MAHVQLVKYLIYGLSLFMDRVCVCVCVCMCVCVCGVCVCMVCVCACVGACV